MDREIPVGNRLIHKKQLERSNNILMNKLTHIKFTNFSKYKGHDKYKLSQHRYSSVNLPNIQFNEIGQKQAKTSLNDDNIKAHNKILYSKLVSQKATISTKQLKQDRLKNVQLLKRIGRYPLNNIKTQPSQSESSFSVLSKQITQSDKNFKRSKPMKARNSSSDIGNLNLQIIKQEHQSNTHQIVLWKKVVQLNKKWYTLKLSRLHFHYSIILTRFPDGNFNYELQLGENIGTQLLTKYDYNYEQIIEECIKEMPQYMCISFVLFQKKYLYRFHKTINKIIEEVGVQQEKTHRQQQACKTGKQSLKIKNPYSFSHRYNTHKSSDQKNIMEKIELSLIEISNKDRAQSTN